MPSVLFVCTGNRYRSVIAEFLFRKKLNESGDAQTWKVASAGTWTEAGQPPFQETINFLQRWNINIKEHLTSSLDEKILSGSGLILVMERGQKEAITSEFPSSRGRVFMLTEIVGSLVYDIPDPVMPENSVEEIGREIYDLINKGFTTICQLAGKLSSQAGI